MNKKIKFVENVKIFSYAFSVMAFIDFVNATL